MTEPRIALWHPDFADEPDIDEVEVARFTSLLGPFLQAYAGLSVDDYWALSVSEHSAMLEWLYITEALQRPSSTSPTEAPQS